MDACNALVVSKYILLLKPLSAPVFLLSYKLRFILWFIKLSFIDLNALLFILEPDQNLFEVAYFLRRLHPPAHATTRQQLLPEVRVREKIDGWNEYFCSLAGLPRGYWNFRFMNKYKGFLMTICKRFARIMRHLAATVWLFGSSLGCPRQTPLLPLSILGRGWNATGLYQSKPGRSVLFAWGKNTSPSYFCRSFHKPPLDSELRPRCHLSSACERDGFWNEAILSGRTKGSRWLQFVWERKRSEHHDEWDEPAISYVDLS